MANRKQQNDRAVQQSVQEAAENAAILAGLGHKPASNSAAPSAKDLARAKSMKGRVKASQDRAAKKRQKAADTAAADRARRTALQEQTKPGRKTSLNEGVVNSREPYLINMMGINPESRGERDARVSDLVTNRILSEDPSMSLEQAQEATPNRLAVMGVAAELNLNSGVKPKRRRTPVKVDNSGLAVSGGGLVPAPAEVAANTPTVVLPGYKEGMKKAGTNPNKIAAVRSSVPKLVAEANKAASSTSN